MGGKLEDTTVYRDGFLDCKFKVHYRHRKRRVSTKSARLWAFFLVLDKPMSASVSWRTELFPKVHSAGFGPALCSSATYLHG
jgi:hypothetical protein